jgi:hypothetical protein
LDESATAFGRKRYRVQKSGQNRLDESATASRNRAKAGWTKALPRPEIGSKARSTKALRRGLREKGVVAAAIGTVRSTVSQPLRGGFDAYLAAPSLSAAAPENNAAVPKMGRLVSGGPPLAMASRPSLGMARPLKPRKTPGSGAYGPGLFLWAGRLRPAGGPPFSRPEIGEIGTECRRATGLRRRTDGIGKHQAIDAAAPGPGKRGQKKQTRTRMPGPHQTRQ